MLYGSSNSRTHQNRNYPLLLAGGGKLGLRHGQYLQFAEKTPLANLSNRSRTAPVRCPKCWLDFLSIALSTRLRSSTHIGAIRFEPTSVVNKTCASKL